MMYLMKLRMEDVVTTKIAQILFALSLLLLIAGCVEQPVEATATPDRQVTEAVERGDLSIVTGQRLYVPAYSEVYSDSPTQTMAMAVALYIRNTNLDKPIIINSVQYYDTNGNLVTDYVDSPLLLAPMATTEYVIRQDDVRGGTGANFIVTWGAEEPVYEPVVEAVMINMVGTQGLSFLSSARVLEEKLP